MVKFGFVRWCVVVGFSCLLLAGCAVNPSAGKMRVATEPAFPPFEFQKQSGELQGFSIDLMNAIAVAANFKLDIQSLPFDGLIAALRAKTVDIDHSCLDLLSVWAKQQQKRGSTLTMQWDRLIERNRNPFPL